MASKGSTITVEVYSVTRLNSSVNGNPAYRLHTSEGDYRTSSDTSAAYDVPNVTRTLPVRVTLDLTAAGRVFGIERSA